MHPTILLLITDVAVCTPRRYYNIHVHKRITSARFGKNKRRGTGLKRLKRNKRPLQLLNKTACRPRASVTPVMKHTI